MILKIIVAGIIGTAVMTLFTNVIAFLFKERCKVVRVLGTMLTFQTTPDKGLSNQLSALMIGTVAHYFVGIVFSFVYAWLWSQEIVDENFYEAGILGFVTGIFAMVVWRIFIALHSNAPYLPLVLYLSAILLGHVFFAIGVLATHFLLTAL